MYGPATREGQNNKNALKYRRQSFGALLPKPTASLFSGLSKLFFEPENTGEQQQQKEEIQVKY